MRDVQRAFGNDGSSSVVLTGLVLALVLAALSPPLVGENRPGAGEGDPCGDKHGNCAEGLWCDLVEGRCNVADVGGKCVRLPEVCADQYAPVCGCNGTNYSNDCERIRAKAQKNHGGKCKGSREP